MDGIYYSIEDVEDPKYRIWKETPSPIRPSDLDNDQYLRGLCEVIINTEVEMDLGEWSDAQVTVYLYMEKTSESYFATVTVSVEIEINVNASRIERRNEEPVSTTLVPLPGQMELFA